MPYYNATICQNGHLISKYDAKHQEFCSICGAETYSYCVKCKTAIRGAYNSQDVMLIGGATYKVPAYCHNCGAAYPWTQKILDNAIELVSLNDELDESSKELIRTAIPNLIVDTPATTPIAVAKYKKGMMHAGDILKNSMRQLLVDVVSETVKKALFP